MVVSEHGHDHIGHAADVGWRIGHAGATANQGLRFFPAAIENHHVIAGAKQVARHPGTHTTQSDEPNFHNR